MLSSTKPTSAAAESIQMLLLGISDFYDKNPIVASIGFLAVTTIWPLKAILNHFYKIKKEDNEKLKAKMQFQIKKEQLKLSASRTEGKD